MSWKEYSFSLSVMLTTRSSDRSFPYQPFIEKKKLIYVDDLSSFFFSILFENYFTHYYNYSQRIRGSETMQVTEKVLLIITAVITAISTLFCVISLGTSSWPGMIGLYCRGCGTASSGLAIVAFLLLVASVVILILLALSIFPKSLRFFSFLILFLATIFTLATYAAYFNKISGYSFKLMVIAHFLSYVASLITAFWLGGSYATTVVAPDNP